jgi:hypothetical protein
MLVADPAVGTKLIAPPMNDEQPHELIAWWPQGYTGKRVGNEVEVHDPDGRLVAVTGTEVFLPGQLLVPEGGEEWSGYWGEMPAGTAFWHCGETTPPLPVYAPPSPPVPDGPFELGHTQEPAAGQTGACSLGWWMAGRLVVDPNGGTAIVVEGGDFGTVGDTAQVWWWPTYTGRSVGNVVQVLDPDGSVVASTGQRYHISLAFPPGGPPFVVCGSDATPLPTAADLAAAFLEATSTVDQANERAIAAYNQSSRDLAAAKKIHRALAENERAFRDEVTQNLWLGDSAPVASRLLACHDALAALETSAGRANSARQLDKLEAQATDTRAECSEIANEFRITLGLPEVPS